MKGTVLYNLRSPPRGSSSIWLGTSNSMVSRFSILKGVHSGIRGVIRVSRFCISQHCFAHNLCHLAGTFTIARQGAGLCGIVKHHRYIHGMAGPQSSIADGRLPIKLIDVSWSTDLLGPFFRLDNGTTPGATGSCCSKKDFGGRIVGVHFAVGFNHDV